MVASSPPGADAATSHTMDASCKFRLPEPMPDAYDKVRHVGFRLPACCPVSVVDPAFESARHVGFRPPGLDTSPSSRMTRCFDSDAVGDTSPTSSIFPAKHAGSRSHGALEPVPLGVDAASIATVSLSGVDSYGLGVSPGKANVSSGQDVISLSEPAIAMALWPGESSEVDAPADFMVGGSSLSGNPRFPYTVYDKISRSHTRPRYPHWVEHTCVRDAVGHSLVPNPMGRGLSTLIRGYPAPQVLVSAYALYRMHRACMVVTVELEHPPEVVEFFGDPWQRTSVVYQGIPSLENQFVVAWLMAPHGHFKHLCRQRWM